LVLTGEKVAETCARASEWWARVVKKMEARRRRRE
jgi:hypothetical protein